MRWEHASSTSRGNLTRSEICPSALDKLVVFLREHLGRLPIAIGHRVVHGGPDFVEPTIINSAVIDRLQRLVPLAPLHQPNNLAPIRIVLERQPQLSQVACFDTSFHRGHPEVADRFAIPEDLYEAGVRRYGKWSLVLTRIKRPRDASA